MLAIVSVGIFFIIRRMVKPVVLLSEQVNRIAMGELTAEPLALKSKDEVGERSRFIPPDVRLNAFKARPARQPSR